MGRRWMVLVGLVATGCYPDFPTLADACPEGVQGGEMLPEGGETFFTRLNCYRRFVNLEDAFVLREAQDASESHIRYLQQNGVLDPESPRYDPTVRGIFVEVDGYSSFTGRDANDRLLAARAISEQEPIGIWSVFFGDARLNDPAVADRLIHDPWSRDPLFQPWWRGAGLATYDVDGVTMAYMDIIYTFPPSIRMDRPIVYPKDGQENLPTGYVPYGAPDDPISVSPVIGYPISITVGSYESDMDDNPYNLVLLDVTITGPDGEVEWVSGGPGSYSWGANQATLIIAPREPLLPYSNYTVEALITWVARQDKVVTTTFTTGPALTVQ